MMRSLIEISGKPVTNFDYFCVDSTEDSLTIGGRIMSKCQPTYDVLTLGADYVFELAKMGATLYEKYNNLIIDGGDENTVEDIKNSIFGIIDFIKNKPPFSYFNAGYSKKVVGALSVQSIDRLLSLTAVYIYLCNDTYTFYHIAVRYFHNAVKNSCRNKKDLASLALFLFSDEKFKLEIDTLCDIPLNQAVNFRPYVSAVPTLGVDGEGNATVKRRVYYSRMLDFFISDMFDGLACGHYVWKCGYCGRYFLMTSARGQLYCQTPPPGKKHPCSTLAKHHTTATEETKKHKQSIKDNPLYVIWQRRDASIRKTKSRGTYPADVCERARTYIRDCYERAICDTIYAERQFASDIEGDKIFKH